jgi:hypothetical protein
MVNLPYPISLITPKMPHTLTSLIMKLSKVWSIPDDKFPFQPGVPLLDDCSSSILTKPINW